MTGRSTVEDVLARLEPVAEQAGKRSDEIEEQRQLPQDVVDGLIESEVFRLWVPARYGGVEGDVMALVRAVELAAYHDGATGWCAMIGGTTALNSGRLPEPFVSEIYGDPTGVTGGLGRPSGTGWLNDDGDLVVSGRWQWGSGTSHCTWIGGGVAIVDRNGEPAALPDGGRAPFVYFRRDEVELLDTWHVSGLAGSGSTDYVVDNVVVPAGRWVSMTGKQPPLVDSPLYRFSMLGALAAGVAGVCLGLASRAVDELVLLGTKVPDASSRTLAERPAVQAELAQADANVRSARAFLTETVSGCWDSAGEGQITDEDKRLLRLAANNAVERSAAAVDLCYRAGGGTAVYRTNPLQRLFRDVHVATQHAMTAPRMWEPLGRMLFGLPTSTAQF